MTGAMSTNPGVAAKFRRLDVDQQLALFWYVYKEMGKSVTPAAPGASTVASEVAEGLYSQVAEMSQEEQLQVQRDLIAGQRTSVTEMYGSLSDNTKLLFWYLLAQGMDNGQIVPFPDDFELTGDAQGLLNELKNLDFEGQITELRNFVEPMGADPTA